MFSRSPSSLQRPDPSEILEALESARTSDDVRHLISKHGYDRVAPYWNRISPAQRGALALVRNFDGVIAHELNQPGPGSPDPF